MKETFNAIEMEVFATSWLAHPIQGSSNSFFKVARKAATEDSVSTLASLAAELARRSDEWDGLFARSLKKRGRCPAHFQPALRVARASARSGSHISSEEATAGLFIRPPESNTKFTIKHTKVPGDSISVSTRTTDIDGFLHLLGPLNDLSRVRVRLNFAGCEHVFIGGLAILALRLRQRKAIVRFANTSNRTNDYLNRIGFVNYITTGEGGHFFEKDRGWNVALQPITSPDDAHNVAVRIVEIFSMHGFLSLEDQNALVTLLAEIVENTIKHSGSPRGIVGAQLYPIKNKIHIVVADTGKGILQSFKESRDPRLAASINSDAVAISRAIQPLVTSKPVIEGVSQGHAGYGLYIASEMVRRNGGNLVITSGCSTIHQYSRFQRLKKKTVNHPEWKGTITQVLLDLNSVLPINEVYRSLPVIPGYEEEDFFEGN